MALKFLAIPEQDAKRVDADAIQRQVFAILRAVNVPDDLAGCSLAVALAPNWPAVKT